MMDQYRFRDNLREAFLEQFDGIADKDGERNEDYEQPEYWQDQIFELADAAVPVYTRELVELWLDLGCPEVDDTGLIEGVHDVSRIIMVAVYEAASEFLYELANEYGLE